MHIKIQYWAFAFSFDNAPLKILNEKTKMFALLAKFASRSITIQNSLTVSYCFINWNHALWFSLLRKNTERRFVMKSLNISKKRFYEKTKVSIYMWVLFTVVNDQFYREFFSLSFAIQHANDQILWVVF